MKVIPTDPYKPRTIIPRRSGQCFQFDSSGKRPPTFQGHTYSHVLVDLHCRKRYTFYTSDLSAESMVVGFHGIILNNPFWIESNWTSKPLQRFIQVDPHHTNISADVAAYLQGPECRYEIRPTPVEDHHGNGIVENTIGK